MIVEGRVESGFEAIRDAFVNNFEAHAEVGAACAVYRDGFCVADLWGGLADPTAGRAWQEDTIQLVFSATKGVTAIILNRMAEQGELDLDAPVASVWRAFAENHKQKITIRQVLSHRAGLANVTGQLSFDEVLAGEPVARAIAAQAPNWEPGIAHGYHARSYGWILGEIVRRVSGKTLGAYFADEIAAPLGLDFWIGLPEDLLARCARTIPPDPENRTLSDMLGADSLTAQVISGPSGLFAYDETWNRPDVLACEMPSSNGVGDARSLARLYAACIGEVDGTRLLSDETVANASIVQSKGPDKVILVHSCFGTGFMLPPMLAPHCGERSFGHQGAGGAIAFADPDAGMSFAYVMNEMRFDIRGDPRSAGLLEALYHCIE